jgi:serine/threonine protein phosphatase PrpC
VKGSTVVCNQPAEADVVTMPVQRGDLIIAATDGVWANMHFDELKDMLLNDNVLEKKSVSYISRLICEAVIRKSTDPFVNDSSIPFIKQAELFGLYWSGGQIDDITVVVSRVM